MRVLFTILILLAVHAPAVLAEPHSGVKLAQDQITRLYKRFERVLEFDVKRHNQMVIYREDNRDRLLRWVNKSLNIAGYEGTSLREAFDLAAKERVHIYTNYVNDERYRFQARLPDSLIRQCKPYGEELDPMGVLKSNVYVKLVHQGKTLYESSHRTRMPSHYNCTMVATESDMEKMLVDGLIPERQSAVPYWMGRFEMEDFTRYSSHLWNAVERVLVESPELFTAKTEDERRALVRAARDALLINLQPTRESFVSTLEALRFPKEQLRDT